MISLRISLLTLVVTCSGAIAQQSTNKIAAVVDGVPIATSEVEEILRAQEQVVLMTYKNDPDRIKKEITLLRQNTIETLIDREILLAEFKKIGGTLKAQYIDEDINTLIRESFKGNRDAFVDELTKGGLTLAKFREQRQKMIIMNVMRARNAGENPPATPREVQDYYDKNVDKWREGDQIKISTITIPKFAGEPGSTPEKQHKLAQELRTKIIQGADFAKLAKTNSQDSHAENGGAWDWMYKTDLMPTIANAAMELKTGGVGPVLDLETSYVIVACDAKKLGLAPDIEKLRPEIEKMINQEKSKANLDKWMASVRKKHVIKRYLPSTATPAVSPSEPAPSAPTPSAP
jgi:parvulin-like peptidyl-prolyl isomerase